MQKLLLTQEELLKILPLSPSQVEKSRSTKPELIKEGKCPPFIKLGARVYYKVSDIENFINKAGKSTTVSKSSSKMNARLSY